LRGPYQLKTVMETAVEVDPGDGTAWARLGAAWEQLGRREEAERALQRARDLGYEPPWDWNSAADYGRSRLTAEEAVS